MLSLLIYVMFALFYSKASVEHRKLTVDIAEVIIKWEVQRIKGVEELDSLSDIINVKQEPKVPTASSSTSAATSVRVLDSC